MIRALLNLRCEMGHRFYSPTPSLWVGRDCDHSEQNRKCGAILRRSYTAPTHPATDLGRSEHSLKAAGVNGLTAPRSGDDAF